MAWPPCPGRVIAYPLVPSAGPVLGSAVGFPARLGGGQHTGPGISNRPTGQEPCSVIVIPTEILENALSGMVSATFGGSTSLTLGLFSDSFTISPATKFSDLHQCTFQGYDSISLDAGSASVVINAPDGGVQVYYPMQSFMATGSDSAQLAFGWMLWDNALSPSVSLMCAERFPTPANFAEDEDTLLLVPTIHLPSSTQADFGTGQIVTQP